MIFHLRNIITNQVTTIKESEGDIVTNYTDNYWTIENTEPEDEQDEEFLSSISSNIDWTEMNNHFLL